MPEIRYAIPRGSVRGGGWGPGHPAPAPEESRTCSAGVDDQDLKTRLR
jgi:hypothetical protein